MTPEQQMTLQGTPDETRKITRMIEVPLNHIEKAELHDEANKLKLDLDQLEKDFKEASDEFKKEIKDVETKLDANHRKMTGAKEFECEQRFFFANNTVQVWNGDSLVEERAMTPEEREGTLPLKHGVVLDSDEEEKAPETDEERREDIADVIRQEQRADKPTLMN